VQQTPHTPSGHHRALNLPIVISAEVEIAAKTLKRFE